MQPLAHDHAAACTQPCSCLHTNILPGSRFHSTMQSLAHYPTAACTLPYSRLHTTIQPLAHYNAAIWTLSGSCLHTIMQSLALWTPISQLPIDQIEKVQCSTEREFPELFKTHQHLTFISGFILVWWWNLKAEALVKIVLIVSLYFANIAYSRLDFALTIEHKHIIKQY